MLRRVFLMGVCFMITLGVCAQSFAADDPAEILREIQRQIITFRNEFKRQIQKAEMDRAAVSEHIQKKLDDLVNKQDDLKTSRPDLKGKVSQLSAVLDTYNERLTALEQTLNAIESGMNSNLDVIETQLAAIQQQGIQRTVPGAGSREPEGTPAETSSFHFACGQLFRAAYRLYMEEEYDIAIGGFQKYLMDCPDTQLEGAAQYWIAESFVKIEAYEIAIQEYDRLIAHYPKSDKVPDSYYGKGAVLLKLGSSADAYTHFAYVIEHFPNTPAAKKARARLEEIR